MPEETPKTPQPTEPPKIAQTDMAADIPNPPVSPEAKAEAAPAKPALRDALRSIKTPEQAEHVAEIVTEAASKTSEHDIQEAGVAAPKPADAIKAAAETPGLAKAPETILETAKQVAGSVGETREALEQTVQEVTNSAQRGESDTEVEAGHNLLLEAILKRMQPFQAVDTRLFLTINHLPHPPLMNNLMYGLTTIMNGGFGWVAGLIIAAALDKDNHRQTLYKVVPPLWFATITVEYPIKFYFRRRRPFIDIVQAIAVGKKPGTFSFPSGHSAAAFAGAWLLRRHYPDLWPLWYAIASLVGFSRIYLGAHYPGDVVVGALSGTTLAELTRWIIDHADEDA